MKTRRKCCYHFHFVDLEWFFKWFGEGVPHKCERVISLARVMTSLARVMTSLARVMTSKIIFLRPEVPGSA